MDLASRTCAADKSEREENDDEEEEDLDERGDVFEPGKDGVRHHEDDEGRGEENGV